MHPACVLAGPIALVATFSLIALPALAGSDRPAPDHSGQWWTNSAGCEYFRADQGGTPNWHLIRQAPQQTCPEKIEARKVRGLQIAGNPKI